jgi:hypothetical protein
VTGREVQTLIHDSEPAHAVDEAEADHLHRTGEVGSMVSPETWTVIGGA